MTLPIGQQGLNLRCRIIEAGLFHLENFTAVGVLVKLV